MAKSCACYLIVLGPQPDSLMAGLSNLSIFECCMPQVTRVVLPGFWTSYQVALLVGAFTV